jgi:hypothetical protein
MFLLQNHAAWLIFYPPFLRVVLRTPREWIWFFILRSGLVEDFEIDAGKLQHPARLSTVEYLSRSKVLQVLVVRKYLYLVNGPLTVSSPMFESFNDCKKFLVVDFVVYLQWKKLPRVERDRVQAVLVVSLR